MAISTRWSALRKRAGRFKRRVKRSCAAELRARLGVTVPVAADAQASPSATCATSAGVPVDEVVQLLFAQDGRPVPPALIGSFAGGLAELLPTGRVQTLSDVRKIILSTERQDFPTRASVQFHIDDLERVQAKEFKILVDPADASVGAVINHSADWEPHTSAVLRDRLQCGMTVLDVGANIGWFSMLAASLVGTTGRVIAVEPWSENARLLMLSVQENNFPQVELWPVALDQQRGWTNFMTFVGSNAGVMPTSRASLEEGWGRIVPTVRLDDLLAPEERVDLVKIDVEGAEYRAIQGAERTLQTWRPPVISEFCPAMVRKFSSAEPLAYIEWFTSRGWSLNVIDRHDGSLRPFATATEFFAWWPDYDHIEDLLFLP